MVAAGNAWIVIEIMPWMIMVHWQRRT